MCTAKIHAAIMPACILCLLSICAGSLIFALSRERPAAQSEATIDLDTQVKPNNHSQPGSIVQKPQYDRQRAIAAVTHVKVWSG